MTQTLLMDSTPYLISHVQWWEKKVFVAFCVALTISLKFPSAIQFSVQPPSFSHVLPCSIQIRTLQITLSLCSTSKVQTVQELPEFRFLILISLIISLCASDAAKRSETHTHTKQFSGKYLMTIFGLGKTLRMPETFFPPRCCIVLFIIAVPFPPPGILIF